MGEKLGNLATGASSFICRVGQNHIYTVYTRYSWFGIHQIYGVNKHIYIYIYIYGSGQPYPYACSNLQWAAYCLTPRVGQNHVSKVYVRELWQGNHQMQGQIRYVYKHTPRVARTILYLWCMYGICGREVTKFKVSYGVNLRFWPALLIPVPFMLVPAVRLLLNSLPDRSSPHCQHTGKALIVQTQQHCMLALSRLLSMPQVDVDVRASGQVPQSTRLLSGPGMLLPPGRRAQSGPANVDSAHITDGLPMCMPGSPARFGRRAGWGVQVCGYMWGVQVCDYVCVVCVYACVRAFCVCMFVCACLFVRAYVRACMYVLCNCLTFGC